MQVTWLIVFAACSGGEPKLTIAAPKNDATLVKTSDNTIDVDVQLQGIRLADPGTCSDAASCGHLVVDVSAITQESAQHTATVPCVAIGTEHAVVTTQAKFKVSLGTCDRQIGRFAVDVFLARDDGSILGIAQDSVRFSIAE